MLGTKPAIQACTLTWNRTMTSWFIGKVHSSGPAWCSYLLPTPAPLTPAASTGVAACSHCRHLALAPIARCCQWGEVEKPSGADRGSSRCLHLLTVPASLAPTADTSPSCSTLSAGANGASAISVWEHQQQQQRQLHKKPFLVEIPLFNLKMIFAYAIMVLFSPVALTVIGPDS
ncbi:hypothetical protein MDA_GLEAN10022492 [Myotis davidii]|uniref:Uncharacterized protein n=1 Tax=Myotis davidii TaxID=225400 RepID=L5MCK9_MYODS|nr:hypothetical protein MDA_GLEAN10022492 [Myotis davidii]